MLNTNRPLLYLNSHPVLDPKASGGWGGGGARNMIYKLPRSVAIFFMTVLQAGKGAWLPWPPGSAIEIRKRMFYWRINSVIHIICLDI